MHGDFVKGTIIQCPACRRPVWALERGISPLEKPGRAITAFRPLRRDDFTNLLTERPDVPWEWQVNTRRWLKTQEARDVMNAERPRAGDACDCPVRSCHGQWVTFSEREAGHSGHERGYILELLDIPPLPEKMSRMGRRVVPEVRELA